ncbi:hypothetical protein KUF71_018614 [Frankliniella fusca]|uniref:RING-type domain-containing protein n=1 Tax=Frankliniella fusca TaxID=407009 RepID=A0AAE1GRG6_9NEOP|nr:hypothetical protein KUF71_018614 [Frankliniella fusca]
MKGPTKAELKEAAERASTSGSSSDEELPRRRHPSESPDRTNDNQIATPEYWFMDPLFRNQNEDDPTFNEYQSPSNHNGNHSSPNLSVIHSPSDLNVVHSPSNLNVNHSPSNFSGNHSPSNINENNSPSNFDVNHSPSNINVNHSPSNFNVNQSPPNFNVDNLPPDIFDDSDIYRIPDDDYSALFPKEEVIVPFAPVPQEELELPSPDNACKACQVEERMYLITHCYHYGLCETCFHVYNNEYTRCPGCGDTHVIFLKKPYF